MASYGKGHDLRSGLLTVVALTLVLSMAFVANLTITSNGSGYITENTYGIDGSSSATIDAGNSVNQSVTVYFFYGSGCPHCAIVEPLIESLAVKYPQVDLKQLEVFHNSANQALFQEFNTRYGVKSPLVPSVFIANESLIGEDAIKANLETSIQRAIEASNEIKAANNANNPSDNNTNGAIIPPGESGIGSADINASTNLTNPPPSTNQTSLLPSTDLTIPMVVVAAAADSINPCAISVMILLLIFLTTLGNRWRVLLVGIVYIATVYIVYFAAGLGILAFLQSMAITRIIYYGAAILSIAIGIVNIRDYFVNKKPTLAIPESRKPMIKTYIEKASVPAAIVLGFAVSMFELPCTGGIYFAILTLLGNEMTMTEGVPYLALYNLIYVLPLAVILAVIYLGVSAERANSWRLEQRKTLRLAMGLVMILLGVVMLLGVV